MPYTDTWGVGVCVCVSVCCLSQSKRENHPVPQEGGWEIEWPYIHKHGWCVCVCVCGKTGGVAGSPSSLARTHSWKTTKPQGWGEGMPQEAEHKTAAVGEGMPQKQRDILFHRGGGAGRIHRDVHYLLKYKSKYNRIPYGGGRARRGPTIHIYIYIYIQKYMYIYIYIFIYLFIYFIIIIIIYMPLCIYTYVLAHIFIYTHAQYGMPLKIKNFPNSTAQALAHSMSPRPPNSFGGLGVATVLRLMIYFLHYLKSLNYRN